MEKGADRGQREGAICCTAENTDALHDATLDMVHFSYLFFIKTLFLASPNIRFTLDSCGWL